MKTTGARCKSRVDGVRAGCMVKRAQSGEQMAAAVKSQTPIASGNDNHRRDDEMIMADRKQGERERAMIRGLEAGANWAQHRVDHGKSLTGHDCWMAGHDGGHQYYRRDKVLAHAYCNGFDLAALDIRDANEGAAE